MVFHIGRERYALPLASVLRVLPVARLKALPGAPHFVPGLLDLHGEAIPVIDLSRLAGTPPDAVRYDTRILLVEIIAAGRRRPLGLKAERVIGVAALDGELADAGVASAPWLGQVAPGAGGMLQLLDPERLLAPEVEALLFGAGP
ncbi:chemotaxis protein CheW [Massilia orientalis]|uniref:Chemotaxis protein CheW n=1 Tax=Massilia orientalis TaxID=3050128 RepID=A0ACC7MJG1_9BURK|nr:chemotaxis protein CheW [Massilia sp. YIM B02787]